MSEAPCSVEKEDLLAEAPAITGTKLLRNGLENVTFTRLRHKIKRRLTRCGRRGKRRRPTNRIDIRIAQLDGLLRTCIECNQEKEDCFLHKLPNYYLHLE